MVLVQLAVDAIDGWAVTHTQLKSFGTARTACMGGMWLRLVPSLLY